jgi:serine/threonine protein kinase
MGSVFLAEQIALGNRHVAIKMLLRKLLDDPEFLRRFHNEAASTARIRHPNVITVYESGQSDDGSPYIAMEYLEGETLRQTLQRRGALPVAETLEIVRQVANGLSAAHKLDIIHRDLKPDNIFLAQTDYAGEGTAIPGITVKVMDFGIARLRESSLTLTGTVLGTPAYMSFEQASGIRGEELDARSDIYSLSVVVYEMLTGKVPFHSDTPLGCVRKHVEEEPPPFCAVAPGLHISPGIECVVMKALRKAREERHSSALDFAREFAAAAQNEPPVETLGSIETTAVSSRVTTPELDLGRREGFSRSSPPAPVRSQAGREPGEGRPEPKSQKWTAARLTLIGFLVVVVIAAVTYMAIRLAQRPKTELLTYERTEPQSAVNDLVPMLTPDRKIADVPIAQVDAALKKGFKRGVEMVSPDGRISVIPIDKQEAAMAGGFKLKSNQESKRLLSVEEFAKLVKTKYPEYKDVDNNKLVKAVLNKYPAYRSWVIPEEWWNPIEDVRRRYPDLKNWSDDRILRNLTDPKWVRSAFPEYAQLSDDWIKNRTNRLRSQAAPDPAELASQDINNLQKLRKGMKPGDSGVEKIDSLLQAVPPTQTAADAPSPGVKLMDFGIRGFFNTDGARKAGYSDDDILSYLTKEQKFDLAGATKAGYSKAEIINYLATTPPKSETPK